MHIAYLTSEFVTEKRRGGLATYLGNIVSIMEKYGHEVTVITLSEQAGRISYGDHIEVVRIPVAAQKNIGGSIGYGLNLLYNSWKLHQALKRENQKKKIDLVQASSYKAVGFFRVRSIPTIVRVSSDSSMIRNGGKFEFDFEKALKERLLEDYLELWCVKKANACFAPSRFCASVARKRTGRRISVIESPFLLKKYTLDERVYFEKLFHKKYLLFNSSLSRLKGTHVGIEAAETLLKKYPDLYMVYAGYDYGLNQKNGTIQSLSQIFRRQNKKYNGRVIYLGHLSCESLFPVIKNSLACVLPSRVDNLPNSCIEAMAFGGIVIGTYGASFEQLIQNKENGFLIKRDSSVALIKAVDYLMGMKDEERLAMKQKAAFTVERLNSQKIYEQMIVFYRKVIKSFG